MRTVERHAVFGFGGGIDPDALDNQRSSHAAIGSTENQSTTAIESATIAMATQITKSLPSLDLIMVLSEQMTCQGPPGMNRASAAGRGATYH